MRIISGSKKSISIRAPKDLPSRPTTDKVKESLFNILINRFKIDEIRVLDLFAGTGNISYEFSSRGVKKIISVDNNLKCIKFIKETSLEHGFDIITKRNDYIDFLPPLITLSVQEGSKFLSNCFSSPKNSRPYRSYWTIHYICYLFIA